MTETWMTRREAAAHLRVSTRQLDRLRLPRSTLGRSPRYSVAMLDEHMLERSKTPGGRKRGGPGRPPLLGPSRLEKIDGKALIKSLRRDLRRRSHR